MREIKFRAWDKEKKVMFKIFDSITQTDWFLPYWKDKYEVMQYTGLNDKNGKEIYEGDIVNINGRKYIVEYWTGQLLVSWYLKSMSSGDTEYMEMACIGESEVIGNIYENSDLLEV